MRASSNETMQKTIRAVSYLIVAVVLVFLGWFLWRYGGTLWGIAKSEHPAEGLSKFVGGFGIWGALVLVLFQTLQIAVAFLPGEPIELAAGMIYGGFWGCILCLIGVLIGSMIVYYAVTKLGQGVISAFHDQAKFAKFSNMKMFKKEKSAEFLTMLLFFVPVMPKDFLTFMAPLTPMKPLRFFIISTLARAPGMFITTYAGVNLLEGNWIVTVILYGIMGIGAVIGFFYYRKISAEDTAG